MSDWDRAFSRSNRALISWELCLKLPIVRIKAMVKAVTRDFLYKPGFCRIIIQDRELKWKISCYSPFFQVLKHQCLSVLR
jgi:hypothetical protein